MYTGRRLKPRKKLILPDWFIATVLVLEMFAIVYIIAVIVHDIKPDIEYLLAQKAEQTIVYQTRYVNVGSPDKVEEELDEDIEVTKALINIARNGSYEEQIAAFGFHWSKVARVITQEAGSHAELCLAVTQCIQNTMYIHPEWTPEDVIAKYQYTTPATFISEEAEEAMERIFIDGQTYTAVGKATMFYNPNFGISSDHETQVFVCEVMTSLGPVRFFEEYCYD